MCAGGLVATGRSTSTRLVPSLDREQKGSEVEVEAAATSRFPLPEGDVVLQTRHENRSQQVHVPVQALGEGRKSMVICNNGW